jgi:hypothetical protein
VTLAKRLADEIKKKGAGKGSLFVLSSNKQVSR